MANGPAWTRVVVEKPFGKDLASCCELMDALSVFSEDQIFKIDHYLGKDILSNSPLPSPHHYFFPSLHSFSSSPFFIIY